MLKPKKTKYNKQQKLKNNKKISIKCNKVLFGEYGLRSLSKSRITSTQIESTRITLSKHMKKQGKIWIRIFPDKPITKKPIEIRQGRGKGDIDSWTCCVFPGTILFEISGINKKLAIKSLKAASYKLPIKSSISTNEYQ